MELHRDTVRRWLGVLHADAPGLTHICATSNWAGAAFDDLDRATDYVAQLHHEGREGIYTRVTTLAGQLAPGKRGGAADTMALPALWADLDLAGPGHAEPNLPPDEQAGRKVVTTSGLPEPTIWVHSGGGLYPIWLLDQPHVIDGDLDDVKDLASGWQLVLAHAADRLGWKYATGVGDLARVLRIPGTTNRKEGLERPCRILSAVDHRYTLDQLHTTLATTMASIATPTIAGDAGWSTGRATRVDGGVSPGDDWAAHTTWQQILEPASWSLAYERDGVQFWTRPGKRTGISATVNALGTDRLHVFSTSTVFDAGTSYNRFAAWAILHHGGDFKAAAKAAKDAGYGQRPPVSGNPASDHQEALADILGRHRTTSPPVSGQATVGREAPPPPGHYGPTEDGLARTLVDHHGHELRYCPQRGRWLRWAGHRWLWDTAEGYREMIRGLARLLPDGPDTDLRRFKTRAMSAIGTTGIARLAQSDSRLVVPVQQLDADPWSLNTPGGIIDLRTGLLSPPDPAALHTRSCAATPDFDHTPKVFDRFLTDTFAGDDQLARYVQRLFGLSSIGTVLEQLFLFAWGEGANGKSTLVEAVMHAVGFGETGYAIAVPAEMFLVRHHTEHPTELAQLAGARLVVASELDDGQKFAEARMKQLTGRDSINARFMRRDPFTFTPSHTLWLLGNVKPTVRTGGLAFWRRVRLLPFLHVVPEGQRDPHLGEKLAEEAPAVLAWLARGAADYHQVGLADPATVTEATAAYQAEQDTIGRWLTECCHLAPGQQQVRIRASRARESYERFCAAEGDTPVSNRQFGIDLRSKYGIEIAKSNGWRFYTGLALLEPDPSAPGSDSSDPGGQGDSGAGGWYR